MPNDAQLFGAAYDRIAADYDDQWSVHVSEPQRRLTRALRLAPGERCADLGCGTGVDTVDMLQRVAPGEVVAVDPSAAMLEAVQRRAHASGLSLTVCEEGADEFIRRSLASSFDVVTLRFCLGYLDWRSALPRLPRLLRPGGRLGILTILATSAPQAYETYRSMAGELGVDALSLTALESREAIEAELHAGGASVRDSWSHEFRLWFPSGERLARWLQASGIATHPLLSALPPDVKDALWRQFAERVEVHRAPSGIPLDFELAGLVAARAARA